MTPRDRFRKNCLALAAGLFGAAALVLSGCQTPAPPPAVSVIDQHELRRIHCEAGGGYFLAWEERRQIHSACLPIRKATDSAR